MSGVCRRVSLAGVGCLPLMSGVWCLVFAVDALAGCLVSAVGVEILVCRYLLEAVGRP